MVQMITKEPHNYRQVDLKPGDPFECDDEHIDLMTLSGRGELVKESKPVIAQAGEYLTRVMAAVAPKQKRKYTKRKGR